MRDTFRVPILLASCAAVFASTAAPGQGPADVPALEQIGLIREVLSTHALEGAEIVFPTATGNRVHTRGSGDWICRGDEPGDDRFSISCYTRSVAPMLDRQRELARNGITGEAMRAQLDREGRTGLLELPDRGMEIYLSGDLDEQGRLPARVSIYYLLFVPFETRDTIGVTEEQPTDPTVPYLHHPGTHEAHVMWMRTLDRNAVSSGQRP